MEITTGSVSNVKLLKPCLSSSSPILRSESPFAHHSVTFLGFASLPPSTRKLHFCAPTKPRQTRKSFIAIISASKAESSTTDGGGERWLLEPVGDGDSRHIGFKVPMPGAFEIASSVVTVGRVPDKADIVIPVATVSALHARIRKNGGNLLVTDLNSTNGTFVNEKRLTPGVTTIVPPGRYITFGDTNLAIFRVSKLKDTVYDQEGSSKPKAEAEDESSTINIQTSST